ncbi:hypothetical protein V2G26_008831 [Clonostachys chloroleuca]
MTACHITPNIQSLAYSRAHGPNLFEPPYGRVGKLTNAYLPSSTRPWVGGLSVLVDSGPASLPAPTRTNEQRRGKTHRDATRRSIIHPKPGALGNPAIRA